MKPIYKLLLIIAVSILAFLINAGIPFLLLVLLIYLEFYHRKKKDENI